MALEATAMLEAQVMAQRFYGAFEQRFSGYGAIQAFFDNAAALLPVEQLQRMKNARNAQDIAFPILQKGTLPIITAHSCNILGTGPTSVRPTITDIVRGFEVKLYDMVHDNNMISEQEAFAQQMANGLRTVMTALDTFGANRLETGKSTSLATVDLPGITIAANAYQIDFANADDLYFILPTILRKNDMNWWQHNNITNTESMKRMLHYEALADNNAENQRAVLEGRLPSSTGPFRHFVSNRIVPGVGVQELHYLVPFGGIGVFTYNHNDAVANRTGPNGQRFYTQTDNIFGIRWNVREERVCEDISATYGPEFTAVYGTKWQFTANFVFIDAYSSDNTRANIKVEVMKAA
jgi:hypothetical protein